MPRTFHFDQDYYRHYYENVTTRVEEEDEIVRRGDFLAAYLNYLQLPMHNVLDAGCGLGHWRGIIARHFPGASYLGVDVSAYLCRRYGWRRSCIADFRSRQRFDLVICQQVLPYLPAARARQAVANLGRLCRGALYMQAITREDWDLHCDQHYTDGSVYLRSSAWYRRELRRWFIPLGGGVFLPKDSPVVIYELEKNR